MSVKPLVDLNNGSGENKQERISSMKKGLLKSTKELITRVEEQNRFNELEDLKKDLSNIKDEKGKLEKQDRETIEDFKYKFTKFKHKMRQSIVLTEECSTLYKTLNHLREKVEKKLTALSLDEQNELEEYFKALDEFYEAFKDNMKKINPREIEIVCCNKERSLTNRVNYLNQSITEQKIEFKLFSKIKKILLEEIERELIDSIEESFLSSLTDLKKDLFECEELYKSLPPIEKYNAIFDISTAYANELIFERIDINTAKSKHTELEVELRKIMDYGEIIEEMSCLPNKNGLNDLRNIIARKSEEEINSRQEVKEMNSNTNEIGIRISPERSLKATLEFNSLVGDLYSEIINFKFKTEELKVTWNQLDKVKEMLYEEYESMEKYIKETFSVHYNKLEKCKILIKLQEENCTDLIHRSEILGESVVNFVKDTFGLYASILEGDTSINSLRERYNMLDKDFNYLMDHESVLGEQENLLYSKSSRILQECDKKIKTIFKTQMEISHDRMRHERENNERVREIADSFISGTEEIEKSLRNILIEIEKINNKCEGIGELKVKLDEFKLDSNSREGKIINEYNERYTICNEEIIRLTKRLSNTLIEPCNCKNDDDRLKISTSAY